MKSSSTAYKFTGGNLSASKRYVLPVVSKIFETLGSGLKVMDLGCGNGSIAKYLTDRGYVVTGIDPSDSGVKIANREFPSLDIHQASVYDENLNERFGLYDVVVSLEVIEHLYYPRELLRSAYDLLPAGGHLVLSTPYHGYFKNLALAITGKMDNHFTVLTDDMHIKFFSLKTLGIMLQETGFSIQRQWRTGRIPPLAASMVILAIK